MQWSAQGCARVVSELCATARNRSADRPNETSRSANTTWPTRDREDTVASVGRALPELKEKLPIRRVFLFGSFVKGRATACSDADLLVACDGPSREDAFVTVRKTVPVRGLERHVYTAEEAKAREDLLGRMTQDGAIIFDRDAKCS
ncbi:MAG: nucleotidyltransferase domain-containing protein [Bacteroidetes bacterium QH_2_63_10]|nr:MAG: nucleotidyltransferase domain-containing protein [Bacteroidetes bacterium QH_2_63_10]